MLVCVCEITSERVLVDGFTGAALSLQWSVNSLLKYLIKTINLSQPSAYLAAHAALSLRWSVMSLLKYLILR